jgi:hypothetical protein
MGVIIASPNRYKRPSRRHSGGYFLGSTCGDEFHNIERNKCGVYQIEKLICNTRGEGTGGYMPSPSSKRSVSNGNEGGAPWATSGAAR